MALTHSTLFRRTLKIFFLFFGFICISCVVFWKALVVFGVQWILNGMIASDGSKPIQYDQVSWEGKTLCLSGLKREDVGYAVCIEKLKVNWKINWVDFRLEPHLALIHPQMTIFGSTSSGSSFPLFLIPHERLKIRLEAELGTLHFSEEPDLVFYFSWIPGAAWESIGMLTLSYDSNLEVSPIFRAEVQRHEEALRFSFHMRERECTQIAPLLAFFQFPWHPIQGDIEVTGFGKVNVAGDLTEFSCQGSACALHLNDLAGESSLYFEKLEGEVVYPSPSTEGMFWKQIQAHLTLAGGEFQVCPEWSLLEVQGTCHVHPDQNPELKLEGNLVTQQTCFPLTIEGQGSAHTDGTFWTDLILKSRSDDAHPLYTYLSCCSPVENQYICQFTCESADVAHLNALFQIAPQLNSHHIEWLEGELQGKVTLTIEQDGIKEVSVDELMVGHLRCALPHERQIASAEWLKGDLLLNGPLQRHGILSNPLWN